MNIIPQLCDLPRFPFRFYYHRVQLQKITGLSPELIGEWILNLQKHSKSLKLWFDIVFARLYNFDVFPYYDVFPGV